jgi:hypothetical protein
MTSLALYQLVEQHRSLEALADSDDIPAEVIRDTLEGLEGDIQAKSVSVAHFFKNLDASADAIDDAVKQMQSRAARLRKRSESIKAYLLLSMQATGITRIECPYFQLVVRNNPPSVVIDNEAEVPDSYKRTPEPLPLPKAVPDKKAIADAIKAGEVVPGAHTTTGQRLEIKL